MFDDVLPIVNWLFSEVKSLATFVWSGGKWVGALVICLPIIRRLINIFSKLFK